MMHDIISDVLAARGIPRERKREVIVAQPAEFWSAGRNALTTNEWRAMSGQMGGWTRWAAPFGVRGGGQRGTRSTGDGAHHH